MANPPCDTFSTINQALAQANADQLNITSFAAACPQVCTLAWGTGNPDLSGIGANISYILQAILTVVFGPVFCYVYSHRERWQFSEKTNKSLQSLQEAFLDGSAQFGIPVAVAAVVRFRQHAPFYELTFLRSLTTMQFLSLLASCVTAGIFEGEDGQPDGKRISLLIVYGLLNFGLYMGLIGGLVTSQASWQTLFDLGQACQAYSQLLPWIKHIPSPGVNLPKLVTKSDFSIFGKKRWKFGLTILGLIFAGIAALIIVGFVLYWLGRLLTSRSEKYLGIISLGLAVGTLVEVVQMERTRNIMKAVTGAEFQDNQWGFGQIISLFLWVPLFLQSFYHISCESSSPWTLILQVAEVYSLCVVILFGCGRRVREQTQPRDLEHGQKQETRKSMDEVEEAEGEDEKKRYSGENTHDKREELEDKLVKI